VLGYARVQDYYDTLPAHGNSPGDIWCNFPTHGLLGTSPTPGIIISPACDLKQRKVDSAVYLPIIPIRKYFSTTAVLRDVRVSIEGQLQQASLSGVIKWSDKHIPPHNDELHAASELLNKEFKKQRQSKKTKDAIGRVKSGINILIAMNNPELVDVDQDDLQLLFGDKAWNKISKEIVCNSFASDVHFLPSDEQHQDFSAIPVHSLVLFRYALSVPIEILECSLDVNVLSWNEEIAKFSDVIPFCSNFIDSRPIRKASLKTHFMLDMITRFMSLYLRVGSPDFSPQRIDKICTEF